MKNNSICRLCGTKSINFVCIFTNDTKTELSPVGEMILDCLFTELQPNSGYPEIVCQLCNLQLNIFCEFRKKVYDTHKVLTKNIERNENDANQKEVQHFNEERMENKDDIQLNEIDSQLNEGKTIDFDLDVEAKSENEHLSQNIITLSEQNVTEKTDLLIDSMPIKMEEDELEAEYLIDDHLYYEEEIYLEDTLDELGENDENQIFEIPQIENENDAEELEGNKDIECKSTLKKCKIRKKRTSINTSNYKKNEITQFTCLYCPEVFHRKTRYMKHVRAHDRKETCTICGKSTFNLAEHKIQHETKFNCFICGKVFNKKLWCHNHELRHSTDRPIQCTICKKGFKVAGDLNTHMLCHNNIRKHMCTFCGKSFRMASHLKVHEEAHNPVNSFQCDVCLQYFKTSRTLQFHKQQLHATSHKHNCPICFRGFCKKDKFLRHLNKHKDKKQESF